MTKNKDLYLDFCQKVFESNIRFPERVLTFSTSGGGDGGFAKILQLITVLGGKGGREKTE